MYVCIAIRQLDAIRRQGCLSVQSKVCARKDETLRRKWTMKNVREYIPDAIPLDAILLGRIRHFNSALTKAGYFPEA
jgi:hypothetical protein